MYPISTSPCRAECTYSSRSMCVALAPLGISSSPVGPPPITPRQPPAPLRVPRRMSRCHPRTRKGLEACVSKKPPRLYRECESVSFVRLARVARPSQFSLPPQDTNEVRVRQENKRETLVNKVDMVENIERNLIEYAYESYSPVRVCEENDMYLCTVTQGEPSLLSLFNIVYLHATNLV